LPQVERLGAFWCDCLLRGFLRYECVGFCVTKRNLRRVIGAVAPILASKRTARLCAAILDRRHTTHTGHT
jgi:hypothetical protein